MPHYQDVDQMVFSFTEGCRRKSIETPPSMVCAKAKQIAESIGGSTMGFKASWGWYSNFRKRYSLGSILLHGKGAEVD